MVLNGLRILVAALDDPNIGVNAMIQRLPLDGSDAAPKRIRRILDPTVRGNDNILRGDFGTTFPALIVSPEEPVVAQGEIEQVYRDGENLSYSVSYATSDSDLAQAMREGLYVCRAIAGVIAELMDVGNIAMRTRNGIVLQYCISITYGTVIDEINEGLVTAAFSANFQVRDINPRL